MTAQHKIHYSIERLDNDRVRIVVRSRLGSPCRREFVIGEAARDDARLGAFRRVAASVRSGRNLTVAERRDLLAPIWQTLSA
jgi:hypothetical protein